MDEVEARCEDRQQMLSVLASFQWMVFVTILSNDGA